MTARERIRREVNVARESLHEAFKDATYRLGFVVRTVEADSRRFRAAFEYGKEAERNFPSQPVAQRPTPKVERVTSTGQRLSRVV